MITAHESFERCYLNAQLDIGDVQCAVDRKRRLAELIFPGVDTDLALMQMEYRIETGLSLDLDKPRDIAAKLQWLKLNDRRRLYGQLVDKFDARTYVQDRVGKEVLIECYGVFAHPSEIDLRSLPHRFALKATHGWGMNLLCIDKLILDWGGEQKRIASWLSVRHERRHAEWAYSLVRPRLIVEALLDHEINDLPDYKFFCFNGEPRFFKVDRRRAAAHEQGYFNLSGDPLPFRNPNVNPLSSRLMLPSSLRDMISIAKALSEGIPFVRVDLYDDAGKPKFGELTLYPCGGNLRFSPWRWSEAVGDMLVLPKARMTEQGQGS